VAGALNCVTAQRLLRRICSNCKEESTYTEAYLKAAGIDGGTFYKGKGCDKCGGSGYKGRCGLYEVMAVTSNIRRLIMHSASTDELRDQGLKEGMLTLRMDGMLKATRGVTTLEEVIKETAST
jgi:type IV pilus assembly protein PilB